VPFSWGGGAVLSLASWVWKTSDVRCSRRDAPGGPRRRPGIGLLAVGLLFGATACVATPDAVEEASAYAAVIRWFVADRDPQAPVFLDGRDDTEIDLAVQAEVVRLLEDYETVRFIDAVNEAVEESLPGLPVREDGVFLRLGALNANGTAWVRVDRYLTEEEAISYRFTLERQGDSWILEDPPELLQSSD